MLRSIAAKFPHGIPEQLKSAFERTNPYQKGIQKRVGAPEADMLADHAVGGEAAAGGHHDTCSKRMVFRTLLPRQMRSNMIMTRAFLPLGNRSEIVGAGSTPRAVVGRVDRG